MKFIFLTAFLLAAGVTWAQPPDAKPLITNGAILVTSEDFEAFLLRAPEDVRPELRASLERIGKALETVYTNRVLAEEAKKAGLDKDPRIRLRAQQIVEGYLAQVWTNQYPKTLETPDFAARAQEMYRLDRARYSEPERLTGTHIVVSLQGRTREMALARAGEALARAKADENFAALAKIYTDDPNFDKTGGRLEEVAAKDLEKPIAQAAFAAKEGAIVGPIETPGGYHIVRVEKKIPARVRPFEEVKEALVTAERDKFANLSTERRIGELKNTPQTVIHEENIKSLVVEISREEIDRAHSRPFSGTPPR